MGDGAVAAGVAVGAGAAVSTRGRLRRYAAAASARTSRPANKALATV
jgi:hypothetical protein